MFYKSVSSCLGTEADGGEGGGNFNNKMFAKSKWYSLLGLNLLLPFIMEM